MLKNKNNGALNMKFFPHSTSFVSHMLLYDYFPQPRLAIWDLWWTIQQRGTFLSQYSHVPLSVSFYHCTISIFLSSSTSTAGDSQIPMSLKNNFPPSHSQHLRIMSKLSSTRGEKKKLSHKITRTHFHKI